MIPPEGRDVQCSECSTTWFQPGRRPERRPPPAYSEPPPAAEPHRDAGEADVAETSGQGDDASPRAPDSAGEPNETDVAAGVAPAERSFTDPIPTAEPEPAPVIDAAPEAESRDTESSGLSGDVESATRVVPENPVPETVDDPKVQRRDLDPGVRDILKAEAEREARLRQAEAEQVETQAEMPLEEEPQSVNRARRRSELEDADNGFDLPPASAATPSGSRRDLLPDIEEINSTLRSSAETSAEAQDKIDAQVAAAAKRRRGVRLGFFLTLALTAGLIWVYVNAPQIAERVPSVAPAVEGFVTQVDRARFWLDDLARGLAEGG